MDGLTPDQARLRDRARELAQEAAAQAAETDRTEQYPWPMVRRMTEAGFMGLTVPQALGGPGRSYFDAVLVIEEMAKACAVCGRIAVEANMGAIGAVMAYGSPAQQRLAAGLVLAGDKPAICITEPEAGSAATEMTTRAVRHGDTWVIDGVKHWITGGGVSRLHLDLRPGLRGRRRSRHRRIPGGAGRGRGPGRAGDPSPHPLDGAEGHAGGGDPLPRAGGAGCDGAAPGWSGRRLRAAASAG